MGHMICDISQYYRLSKSCGQFFFICRSLVTGPSAGGLSRSGSRRQWVGEFKQFSPNLYVKLCLLRLSSESKLSCFSASF